MLNKKVLRMKENPQLKFPCYFDGNKFIIEVPSGTTGSWVLDAINSGDLEIRINEDLP